jgi:hypothetical protein
MTLLLGSSLSTVRLRTLECFAAKAFFFPHEFNKNASGESSSHVVHACLCGFLLLFFPSVSVGFTAEICLVALLAKLTLYCALAHTGVFRGEGFFLSSRSTKTPQE